MRSKDITPAALIVVIVLGGVTAWLAAVVGLLYLRGDIDAAKDAGLVLGTTAAPLVAILAKTGSGNPEPGQTTVTTDTGTPVTTGSPVTVGEPVVDQPVAPLFDDAGHADATAIALLVLFALVLLLLTGVLPTFR